MRASRDVTCFIPAFLHSVTPTRDFLPCLAYSTKVPTQPPAVSFSIELDVYQLIHDGAVIGTCKKAVLWINHAASVQRRGLDSTFTLQEVSYC
ncbi:hypothetical protein BP00DRAFT_128488 [Aspergillus indologenus CBS 114.80]|uniref:Uncharacterized protein n=1 Tax=Aspergillus indologenus CBS 114.80 TaxID=1450541 RepID=A0A2V5IFZ7_9EURO|nr:hypothetical protein BP00DRAFT_128488 [Aspergillus indologenus CBS 114.80]